MCLSPSARHRGRLGRLRDQRNKYSDLKIRFFHAFGVFAATGNNPFLLLLAGVALFAAIMPGVQFYRTEDDFAKLYVYQNSRVQGEQDLYNARFGGLGRFQSLIVSSPSGDGASLTAMRALLDVATPGLKRHEPELCAAPGDTASRADAGRLPASCAATYNRTCLYCACASVAANPREVSVPASRILDNGTAAAAAVRQADLCEQPPVPTPMAPSLLESIPPSDPAARAAPQWATAYGDAVRAAGGLPATLGVTAAGLASALDACAAAYEVTPTPP